MWGWGSPLGVRYHTTENDMPAWPPKRPLTFKPPGKPRLTALREFDLDHGNTIVAIFQGSRGMQSDLDIIVKYWQKGKGRRTPAHIHWAIDLLLKRQHDPELTTGFIHYLIDLYDCLEPFASTHDRLERPLITTSGEHDLQGFRDLDNYGEYSVEFTACVLELIGIQEKTGNPDAYLYRKVLTALLDAKDIFALVSTAILRGQRG